ncbi:hypothetical protein PPERSA_00629 [Pseudocohnilembus persalinus]|uniref:Uncharacterized protein n=1 Tax=Pseudocohnilembus persalinus TaxID=266149 RepID=A0A0V0QTJ1_PSEPJ|nr:hypothetical protein PPERSA_00629 [Pseudocohnilembus persalinus]|eukprot:KRX05328.1 hypothetical protein PPERSA_00629 [Pseudocohnilembus persalinus]
MNLQDQISEDSEEDNFSELNVSEKEIDQENQIISENQRKFLEKIEGLGQKIKQERNQILEELKNKNIDYCYLEMVQKEVEYLKNQLNLQIEGSFEEIRVKEILKKKQELIENRLNEIQNQNKQEKLLVEKLDYLEKITQKVEEKQQQVEKMKEYQEDKKKNFENQINKLSEQEEKLNFQISNLYEIKDLEYKDKAYKPLKEAKFFKQIKSLDFNVQSKKILIFFRYLDQWKIQIINLRQLLQEEKNLKHYFLQNNGREINQNKFKFKNLGEFRVNEVYFSEFEPPISPVLREVQFYSSKIVYGMQNQIINSVCINLQNEPSNIVNYQEIKDKNLDQIEFLQLWKFDNNNYSQQSQEQNQEQYWYQNKFQNKEVLQIKNCFEQFLVVLYKKWENQENYRVYLKVIQLNNLDQIQTTQDFLMEQNFDFFEQHKIQISERKEKLQILTLGTYQGQIQVYQFVNESEGYGEFSLKKIGFVNKNEEIKEEKNQENKENEENDKSQENQKNVENQEKNENLEDVQFKVQSLFFAQSQIECQTNFLVYSIKKQKEKYVQKLQIYEIFIQKLIQQTKKKSTGSHGKRKSSSGSEKKNENLDKKKSENNDLIQELNTELKPIFEIEQEIYFKKTENKQAQEFEIQELEYGSFQGCFILQNKGVLIGGLESALHLYVLNWEKNEIFYQGQHNSFHNFRILLVQQISLCNFEKQFTTNNNIVQSIQQQNESNNQGNQQKEKNDYNVILSMDQGGQLQYWDIQHFKTTIISFLKNRSLQNK